MLGLGLAALPQKLLAEVVGFAIETALVAGFAWHYGAAHVQGEWDIAKAAQVTVDAAQNAKNRGLEQAAATARQEAADARAHEQIQVASTRAAFSADADRMRGTLADALSGRGATEDSLAACQQRAASAGNLLADGLQVQADLAGSAESLAADVRAVLDPKYTAAVTAALNAAASEAAK